MTVARWFFRSAVTCAILGMAGGLYMGIINGHTQMPAHVHMLLAGWVSMFLFATIVCRATSGSCVKANDRIVPGPRAAPARPGA